MLYGTLLLGFITVVLGLSDGDLNVSVKAVSSSVGSIDDIVISAIVANPTDKDIRVIAKNNILDSSGTKSFDVRKDGKDVPFTGIRAMFDLSVEGVYTTIPAKSFVAVNHTNIAPLYDFEASGTGTFSFTPINIFQTRSGAPLLVIDTPVVEVNVNNDVQKRLLFPPELSIPQCSDSGKLQIIRDAVDSGRSLAGAAASDIRSHPNSAEFNTYFSCNTPSDIASRMDMVANDFASSGTRNISCSDPQGNCAGAIFYIATDIFLCDSFFTIKPITSICTGGFTQLTTGGLMITALSWAMFANITVVGCPSSIGLSATGKRNNADNYNCMAAAIYQHYNC